MYVLDHTLKTPLHIDLDTLESRAEAAGIKLYFASRVSGGTWEALRRGFGGFNEQEIDAARYLVSLFLTINHCCSCQ